MTDVGNRDQQTPAVRRFAAACALANHGGLAIDRIVEVARIFTIDRDERDIGQVDALFAIDRADLVGQARSLRQRLC